ncbi:hypothetical protein FACS1894187_13820 [Synergistales bacterium]|nr:hypothetical protein FACS1894187_13820 [Synergistales bacterium]
MSNSVFFLIWFIDVNMITLLCFICPEDKFKAMLMEKFSIEVTQMEDSLKAVILSPDIAQHLRAPAGAPALETRRAVLFGGEAHSS